MATMNVSLPEAMKKWVNSQVKTGRFGNASDYIRDLIRRDQDQLNKITELRAQLERDAKAEKNVSAKTRTASVKSVKAKAVPAKSVSAKGQTSTGAKAKGKRKEPSMEHIRKNVLARVKKNWRPSE